MYFRTSREQRVGKTLKAFVADRDARLAAFRASLAPLRATLKVQPFFGGDEPLYADYAMFGQFQWARCISPFALLEEGDPVKLWRDRLLDRFDGLARKTAEDIGALVAYLRTVAAQTGNYAVNPAPTSAAQQPKDELGRHVFEGGCVNCHEYNGDGRQTVYASLVAAGRWLIPTAQM